MKTLYITLACCLFTVNSYSQKEILKSSEIKFNQNGTSIADLFAFAHVNKKIYKRFGLWNFLYLDRNYAEVVAGPSYTSKNIMLGAGYGYEFIGKTIVIAATLKLNYRKFNFTGYAEDSEGWYWYYSEINKKIKNNFEIGLYNQALIGTGLQLKKNVTDKTSFTLGAGYRQNDFGYNGSPIVGKFVLNLNF